MNLPLLKDGPKDRRMNFHQLRASKSTQRTTPAREYAKIPSSVEDGKLLRTHTSPVQIRTMLEQKPPIRIIAPGAVL